MGTTDRPPEPNYRDALAAVREAIDIPYGVTYGDDQVRARIMERRVMHAAIFLRALERDDLTADVVAWRTAHLREVLADHPPVGYQHREMPARSES